MLRNRALTSLYHASRTRVLSHHSLPKLLSRYSTIHAVVQPKVKPSPLFLTSSSSAIEPTVPIYETIESSNEERWMAQARSVLRNTFGHEDFTPGQEQILKILLSNNNAAAIFPTASGKSICFQIPGVIFPGLVIVVSPLIAIMKEQVDFLKSKNINVERIDSEMSLPTYIDNMRAIQAGAVKMIYISPERFTNAAFLNAISDTQISLLAIDEAHCISEWGVNFRPDYLKVAQMARQFQAERILVLTATATPTVIDDLCREMDPNNVIRTGFYRSNLTLLARVVKADEDKSNLLLGALLSSDRPRGPTIVYVTLRKDAEKLAVLLQREELQSVRCYHAGLDTQVKNEIQDWFLKSNDGIVVSTIAFGMGINKPDIRYIYHFNSPKSIEEYAQEIGRAGRDGKESICEAYIDVQFDVAGLERLLVRATPTVDQISQFLNRLLYMNHHSPDGLITFSLETLSGELGISENILNTYIVQIELHKYVTQLPRSTNSEIVMELLTSFHENKVAELADFLRRNSLHAQLIGLERIQQLMEFFTSPGCLHSHMAQHFQQDTLSACGHCQYCITKAPLVIRGLNSSEQLRTELSKFGASQSGSKRDLLLRLERMSQTHSGVSNCELLGKTWENSVYPYREPSAINISATYDQKPVYTSFSTIEEFFDQADICNLSEVLLSDRPRHLFVELSWDREQLPDDEFVLHSFYNYLNAVLEEVFGVTVTEKQIISSYLYAQEAGYKLWDTNIYQIKFQLPKVFRNANDFKAFYRLLQSRLCQPRNSREEEWYKHLFYTKKGKMYPVLNLNMAEPVVQVGSILWQGREGHPSRTMTPCDNTPTDLLAHLVGVYDTNVEYWSVDGLPATSNVPIGLMYKR